MADRINTDGARAQVQPQDGKAFTLQELQGVVGGYIEIVALADGRFMVVNEEGKLQGLRYNAVATAMTRGRLAADDLIVGDVLVCTDQELGETPYKPDEEG